MWSAELNEVCTCGVECRSHLANVRELRGNALVPDIVRGIVPRDKNNVSIQSGDKVQGGEQHGTREIAAVIAPVRSLASLQCRKFKFKRTLVRSGSDDKRAERKEVIRTPPLLFRQQRG